MREPDRTHHLSRSRQHSLDSLPPGGYLVSALGRSPFSSTDATSLPLLGSYRHPFLHLHRRDGRHLHRQEPPHYVPQHRTSERCSAPNRHRHRQRTAYRHPSTVRRLLLVLISFQFYLNSLCASLLAGSSVRNPLVSSEPRSTGSLRSSPSRVNPGSTTPTKTSCSSRPSSTKASTTLGPSRLSSVPTDSSESLEALFGEFRGSPCTLRTRFASQARRTDFNTFCPSARIFTIPKLGSKLKQDITPLSYTPRRFVSHPTNKLFYIIESEHRTHGPVATKRLIEEKVRSKLLSVVVSHLALTLTFSLLQVASGSRIDHDMVNLAPEVFGRPKAEAGNWASCIRVIDPIEVSPMRLFPSPRSLFHS